MSKTLRNVEHPETHFLALDEDLYPYYLWPSGCGKTLEPTHTVFLLDPSSSVEKRISLADHEAFKAGIESGVDVIVDPSALRREGVLTHRDYTNDPYPITGRSTESNVTDDVLRTAYCISQHIGKPFSGIREPIETTKSAPAGCILDMEDIKPKNVDTDICCHHRFTPNDFEESVKGPLIENDTFAKFKNMKWNLKLKSLKSEIEANENSNIHIAPPKTYKPEDISIPIQRVKNPPKDEEIYQCISRAYESVFELKFEVDSDKTEFISEDPSVNSGADIDLLRNTTFTLNGTTRLYFTTKPDTESGSSKLITE